MKKEISRQEIEEKLQQMGDYVKMDFLQRSLKTNLDFDTRRFVQIKLAKIYESRNMFAEAGRLIKNSADINTTFKGKIQDYIKSAELFIRGGNFDESENVLKRALACGNSSEKSEIKDNYKKFLLVQSEIYLNQDKRNQARKVLERTLLLDLSYNEKREIQDKLLKLYEKLGLIREHNSLKKNM